MKIYNWEIDVVELDSNNFTDYAWGEIIYKEKLIRLNSDIPDDLKRQTLIHEIVHAIQFYMGYNEELKKEEVCNFIAAHLSVINAAVDEYFKEV